MEIRFEEVILNVDMPDLTETDKRFLEQITYLIKGILLSGLSAEAICQVADIGGILKSKIEENRVC